MKKEPQLLTTVKGFLPVVSREELVALLQQLNFHQDKYGDYKFNNYRVSIEQGSSFHRWPKVYFYHMHTLLHSDSDFAAAYNTIYTRLNNN